MEQSNTFLSNLPKDIAPHNAVEMRLLQEYGSMFVARGVASPTKIVFEDADDVLRFQNGVESARHMLGDFEIELQRSAMADLTKALAEATSSGLSITPRGADSAKRSYEETVGLWASRVEPALKHWVSEGKLTQKVAENIRSLSPFQQVPVILGLEEKGIYFAKDLSKTILYSVAPPGTSQHLAMLALDIQEFENPEVRKFLARWKWYQTVVSDLPHFTYLGVEESELPTLGLKKVADGDRTFWVPDF
ncbi:MAG: hypothetical protein ACJ72Z_11730 [Pyrinomonadaceae bacterium]